MVDMTQCENQEFVFANNFDGIFEQSVLFRVLPEVLNCGRRRGIFTTVNLHCSRFVQTLL